MNNFRSVTYQGSGPEIVWVGEGSEICGLGYEETKYQFLKSGKLDVLTLGLRTGIFLPKVDAKGNPLGIMEAFHVDEKGHVKELPPSEHREVLLEDLQGLAGLEERWQPYFFSHTGIRSIGSGDLDWFPPEFLSHRDLQTHLPQPWVTLLQNLGVKIEILKEIPFAQAKTDWRMWEQTIAGLPRLDENTKVVEVSIKWALAEPFPFKTDLGSPLPTGWHQSERGLLGLTRKEALGINPALMMAHEVVYRALLNACLHPEQNDLWKMFSPDKLGLYLGSGIGPHPEHQQMIVDTLEGNPCGAKSLANCIANIACGYISARLGIKGKISTHVGACESCLGSIADAYWDLKAKRFEAAIAGGFEDTMTASSYNGFISNLAFTTNEKLLQNLSAMVEEGVFPKDSEVARVVQERLEKFEHFEQDLATLEKEFKDGKVDYYSYQINRRKLREEKRKSLMQLPKTVTRYASMPFAKYRSGFVMGVGGGAGFFTTLDHALENGLPIRAILAGVSEMVPDSGIDGTSIAALGDGIGDAYERAFQESGKNYRGLTIEDIGVWYAHGTSTPQNGWGERREIERVHQKLGRDPNRPIMITGDKAEVGHRVGGNFPSLVGYIFEKNEVLAVGNYLQAGHEPVGRRGFGVVLDELFPSSRVVGKAGLGSGKPVPYSGDYVAVNGAGFGRINTVLIFKRFEPSQIEAKTDQGKDILKRYPDRSLKSLHFRRELSHKILFGSIPLIRSG